MPRLWLALSVPALPLAVFARTLPEQPPLAIATGHTLFQVNEPAHVAGIRPGMSASAARALLPGLRILPRNSAAEQRALQRLADWALQYTSYLEIQPPDGLLLEIAGSLRLFGGLDSLLKDIRHALSRLGYQGRWAVAPTPSGAWLLNRGGDSRPVLDLPTLRERLSTLPWSVLSLEEQQRQALHSLGLDTLGDCLRLPRSSSTRRFGQQWREQLDKALGHVPDLRPAYRPAPYFDSRLDLPAPVTSTEPILFVLHRLLLELTGYLRGRDAGVQRIELELEVDGQDHIALSLGLRTPSRDLNRLLNIARERLARLSLSAPVHALVVRAQELLPLHPAPEDLFEPDAQADIRQSEWLERIQARLGAEAVRHIQVVADHRPEHAWRYTSPDPQQPPTASPLRPLWLLSQPRPISQAHDAPYWHGALSLLAGPERIEGGWWDETTGDISRDYYVALNPRSQYLWIFYARRQHRWYLHGLFA